MMVITRSKYNRILVSTNNLVDQNYKRYHNNFVTLLKRFTRKESSPYSELPVFLASLAVALCSIC